MRIIHALDNNGITGKRGIATTPFLCGEIDTDQDGTRITWNRKSNFVKYILDDFHAPYKDKICEVCLDICLSKE